MRLIAKLPTIVAAFARIRRGDEYVPPRDGLDFSENFLYMLSERRPDPVVYQVFDACLVLHAEPAEHSLLVTLDSVDADAERVPDSA